MNLYFAEVTNITDPMLMGRVQVQVLNLESQFNPTSEWFYCINNGDSSVLYNIGDRVLITFLNQEANNIGLVLGRVNVFGTLDKSTKHMNLVEQGFYNLSSFSSNRASKPYSDFDPSELDFTFNTYGEVRTKAYQDNLLNVTDKSKTLIQDNKGSFIFFDSVSNMFLKSIAKLFIYAIQSLTIGSIGGILLKVNNNISVNIGLEEIKITYFQNTITLGVSDISLKVGGSLVKVSNSDVSITSPMIFLN